MNALQKMFCLVCLTGGLVGDVVAGDAKADGGVLARRVADGLWGCLAENNSGRPGYDGDYTHFQSSIAAKLYLASDDPRILRLVNLFLNQMLPHVDRDTWIFDATAGSRHSTMLPLTTPAYAVSALECNRKKLLAELDEQVSMTLAHYSKAAKEGWMHPGMYRGLNGELFTLLQACMRPAANGKASAP
jgi:hypothetical protein